LRKAGHRVLAPDVGGLGSSQIPDAERDVHAMAQQVVDAMATLPDLSARLSVV
jgi:hypothetical protein